MPYKINPFTGDFDYVLGPAGGTASTTFNADSGSATPTLSGVLTLAGGTNGIDTVASGSTVTFNFDVTEQPAIPTSVATDSGTATPATNVLTIAGDGSGIDTSATGSTVTVSFDVSEQSAIPTSFATDSGTATPATNSLTVSGGSGIATSGSGSTLTISNTGGGFVWNEVTGTSDTIAVQNGYITNNAGLVTLTLPSSAAIGDVFIVTGKGAGGWRIAQNASQLINFGSSTTTTGTGGRLDSTGQFDSIQLVCITANTTFNVINSQGNITVT